MRNIIPRADLATAISETIQALARDMAHDKEAALKIAATRLESAALRSDEIFLLLKLISEDRIRCTMCGKGVPASRMASGARCLMCAQRMKNNHEYEESAR